MRHSKSRWLDHADIAPLSLKPGKQLSAEKGALLGFLKGVRMRGFSRRKQSFSNVRLKNKASLRGQWPAIKRGAPRGSSTECLSQFLAIRIGGCRACPYESRSVLDLI